MKRLFWLQRLHGLCIILDGVCYLLFSKTYGLQIWSAKKIGMKRWVHDREFLVEEVE